MRRILVLVALALCACGPDKPAVTDPQTNPSATTSATAPEPSATAASPTSPEAAKGLSALQNGDYPAAKTSFEAAIAAHANDADAHHYLGVTLEKLNDKTGAEREYKAALAIHPDLAEAAANLGALYVDAQKWDEAITVLKTATARRNDSAPAYFNLALAYVGKGDQPSAGKAFDAALKITPTDAMLLYTYGHTLATWNQSEAAVAKLKAARDAATQSDLLGSIGHDLLVLRAVPDCITTFDKAIQPSTTPAMGAQFRTDRALCKLAAKDEAGATSDLEAAVQADPKYGLAHYWLATRRMSAKKWADAAKELEAYLKLEPTGPKAKTAQEALVIAKNGGKKK
jgi:Tfp pilus assembly protein PilF